MAHGVFRGQPVCNSPRIASQTPMTGIREERTEEDRLTRGDAVRVALMIEAMATKTQTDRTLT